MGLRGATPSILCLPAVTVRGRNDQGQSNLPVDLHTGNAPTKAIVKILEYKEMERPSTLPE